MGATKTIAKNTLALYASSIIGKVLSLLFILYTSHYLGDTRFGLLSFMLSLTSVIVVFTDMGLGPLTTREISRNKAIDKKYLVNTTAIKLLLSVPTIILMFAIALLTSDAGSLDIFCLFAVYLLFNSFITMFYCFFQAYETMEFQSIGEILTSALLLAGGIAGVASGYGVRGFSVIYAASAGLVLLYCIATFVWKHSVPAPRIDLGFWKPTMREALPFGLTGGFMMIYTYADSILLHYMKGDAVVGWYSAAYRLMLFVLFVPVAINISIFPSMSRFYISSIDSLKLIYEKYFKLMTMLALPMGIGTTLVADKLIYFIYGSDFGGSILALQILIWTMVLTFMGAAFVRLFESTNKQRMITSLTCICAVINVALNLLLIPVFSYIGSSVITVITECILVGGVFIYAYRFGYGIKGKKLLTHGLKVLVSSAVMGIFILTFRQLSLPIIIMLAAAVYFTVYYLIRGVDNDDIQILRQIIVKNSK